MVAYLLAKARMGDLMGVFDWHADRIDRDTPVTRTYRNTQNVRRFLVAQCGPDFRFDRPFMAWIKDGAPKTMGDVADEWLRRQGR